MPRFFFHFTNGRTLRDEDGEDSPSLEAATAHAAKIAAELAKEPESRGFAVSVTDAQGNELAYVTIGRRSTEAIYFRRFLVGKVVLPSRRPMMPARITQPSAAARSRL